MNKDMKGVCLFLGGIGLAYALFLMLVVLFTGVKIVKSIVFIVTFSLALITIGLNSQVRTRLLAFAKSKFTA
ncbi:hypothetical protein EYS14_04725 [Alteromonadaceae bacterium M269]|nr:hypothetical protein EYS14_04725 [Alteromonadaceae bacterium M269]